jgi:hypothetical protein
MATDTKQNQQNQQAAELQSDQLDQVVGGRKPVITGGRKPGGKTEDPCAGGE